MIPYGRQSISDTDIEHVVSVLRSDFLTQGPLVPAFERSVAGHVGAEFAIAANSATSALHIACLALDVGPGDTVWTTAITFVASANCALYCGANIDFVDINPLTGNMCIERLRAKLEKANKEGKLPKVVIPVHLCGQSCDMASISELAGQFGFRVIEDASHAIGGKYEGSFVGNCKYSDITVFSFHPVKIITTGEGGVATTNSHELSVRMRQFRSHGITSDPNDMEPRPSDEIWNYQQKRLGYNYRLTDIQAALGLSQLARLDEFVAKRHAIAAVYDTEFARMPVVPQKQIPEAYSSYHLYTIRIRESHCGKTQRQIYDGFWREGIAVNLHYIPVYRQPYFERLGFESGYCYEAERYHQEVLSLPMFPTLSEQQQFLVIDVLQKLFKD